MHFSGLGLSGLHVLQGPGGYKFHCLPVWRFVVCSDDLGISNDELRVHSLRVCGG